MIYKYLVMCLLAVLTCRAQAGLIAEYEHRFGGGGTFATPYLDYELRTSDRSAKLFDELVVDISNVGDTFVANSTNADTFSIFEGLFTNGIEDSVWLVRLASPFPRGGGSGGGSRISESTLFQGLTGVDLSAYALDSIELSIDEITYHTDYASPFSPGRVFDHWTNSRVTLSFHGSAVVPIGGPVSLLGLGLLMLMITLQRRNRAAQTNAWEHISG